jgi:hypothetical protein
VKYRLAVRERFRQILKHAQQAQHQRQDESQQQQDKDESVHAPLRKPSHGEKLILLRPNLFAV